MKIISVAVRMFLLCCAAFLIFCVLYFFKSRLPFQFSKKYEIHQYFPFNYLYRSEVIGIPDSGNIMHDNFDSFRYFSKWYHLWAEVKDSVETGSSREGYKNSSCLTVKNTGMGAWTLSPGSFIRVIPGDMISFQAEVMKEFKDQDISLQFRGFNQVQELADSKLARTKTEISPGKWESLRIEIQIPAGIGFITPKIRGTGPGLFKIDNIELKKEKSK